MTGVDDLFKLIGWVTGRVGDVFGLVGRTGGAALGQVERLASTVRLSPGTDDLSLTVHRAEQAESAILFVHGFGANEATWGRFPDLLVENDSLEGWDVFSLGFNTGLAPDIPGLWSADPSIARLATYLSSRVGLAPIREYRALALVAHSMGGLVVQRALVDDPDFTARVSHVFFFGTPSAGLRKAQWGRFLKPQIGNMAADGPFISDLRNRWDDQFGQQRPFSLWTVAGDRDVFVPADSALDPFPPDTHVVVPGNHLEIVLADDPGSMSVQVVVEGLVGDAAPGGPWNAARVAVERRDFQRAVDQLRPHATELDEQHVVELALALDAVGRRDEAIEVLRASPHVSTDAQGTLAGRLKRSWLSLGKQRDATSALELYRDAYAAAAAAGDHEQAAYLGINVAFLQLTFEHDPTAARKVATDVLNSCARSRPGHWRSATVGEAELHLGESDAALAAYREAVALEPTPRQLESMYLQASRLIAESGDQPLQRSLDEVLRPAASPS